MKRIDINDVKVGDFIYLRGGEFTTINPYYFDTAVFWSLYSLRVGIAEVIQLGEDVFTNRRSLKCKILMCQRALKLHIRETRFCL